MYSGTVQDDDANAILLVRGVATWRTGASRKDCTTLPRTSIIITVATTKKILDLQILYPIKCELRC